MNLHQDTSAGSPDFFASRSARIGLAIVFPFGDTGRIRGKVREAESQVREQEQLRNQTQLIVRREVVTAYTQLIVTSTLVQLYEQSILPQADDLLKKAQSGFSTGETTLLEYLEAQRTHRDTHIEHLGILGDNSRARAELERAVGATVI